ncbi:hypothetical protein AAVH_02018 [Aphelenchoides avenae]|nr:hypothetical protein AAVH_02018 [Aphelenchus avenae]
MDNVEPAVKRLFLELAGAQNPMRGQEESPATPAPRFSDEDDARLIYLVQQYPILWDSRRSDYSSNHKKSAAWKAISEDMDMSTLNLRLRFSYLKRKFLNVYGRVKNAQVAGAVDSPVANVPETRLPWYISMSYLLPVADSPNPRPTSARHPKKPAEEWNLAAFDNLFGEQSCSGDDTGDGADSNSNGASASASDGLMATSITNHHVDQETQSTSTLFPTAPLDSKGAASGSGPGLKPAAPDAAVFQRLLEALAGDVHDAGELDTPDDIEPFLKQVEVDLKRLTEEKRDYARLKILTFLYELKSGSETPQLTQNLSKCCPCVTGFVTKMQALDASKTHLDLHLNNHS